MCFVALKEQEATKSVTFFHYRCRFADKDKRVVTLIIIMSNGMMKKIPDLKKPMFVEKSSKSITQEAQNIQRQSSMLFSILR